MQFNLSQHVNYHKQMLPQSSHHHQFYFVHGVAVQHLQAFPSRESHHSIDLFYGVVTHPFSCSLVVLGRWTLLLRTLNTEANVEIFGTISSEICQNGSSVNSSAGGSCFGRPRKNGNLISSPVNLYTAIFKQNKMVLIMWIPSHHGISGNENADSAGKEATRLLVHDSYLTVSYTDAISFFKTELHNRWRTNWIDSATSKVHDDLQIP
ncbi:hypothetical protein C0J52_11697 [Blattella germanica]|nr:hypothetical protein C0J52_11697 [Blattella germanica]